jgi:hypothetical protein
VSYIIKFTPEAEDTFDALSEQLANRWGLEYVYQFEDRVIKALNIISETPLLYPIIVESSQIRKCVLHRSCSLLYKVIDNSILIICFWDSRQDPLFI